MRRRCVPVTRRGGGAAARVALHLLMDTALMAPIRGWVKRAERLLEGYDETPTHAWVAVVRATSG